MARINLFNWTNEEISDVVEGEQVVVPANGSTETSERKAQSMMDHYKGKLSLSPRPDYSDEAKQVVAQMKKDNLVSFCYALMDRQKPDPNDFLDKSTSQPPDGQKGQGQGQEESQEGSRE